MFSFDQMVTTDHSPLSPSSSASSPRFVFPPEMHSSTSSGHSTSSPFPSPIKREVKWEVPPQNWPADMDISDSKVGHTVLFLWEISKRKLSIYPFCDIQVEFEKRHPNTVIPACNYSFFLSSCFNNIQSWQKNKMLFA